MLTLASWPVAVLSVLFIIVCVIMTLVILIQKPRGGGLSGAFGGAGGAVQQAFGSKVGDILTWFTVGCFVAFLVLAMGLTWAARPPKPPEESLIGADKAAATSPADPVAPTSPMQGPPIGLPPDRPLNPTPPATQPGR